ncbi:serine hydrolase domain-containing protein [Brevundimonas aveniformis]|uniref:serine hydrolase domain-containing protein n=1 Tax=Brevundimonas aveniformis TaxID=370977 RepID=UPI0003F4C655|nr:serine hydrolase domain-containing protein [Brevundimonas aveniformis]
MKLIQSSLPGVLALGAACLLATPALSQPSCPAPARFAGPPIHAPPAPEAWPAPATFAADPFPSTVTAAFDAVLARAVERSEPLSLTAALWQPGVGFWSSRWDAPGVEPRPLHWWASVGKLAVAASVLQLVEEESLTLDAPLTRWRVDVSHGDQITVDQLLTHTSGLFSANEDLAYRAEPHSMNVDEQVAVAERNGAVFCPGTGWRYSNTNYALLGQIIEIEDERPWSEAVQARILDRLGVDGRVLSADADISDIQPLGPPQAGEPAVDPRWPGAAGGIAATPEAVIRLLHGVLTGELLATSDAHAMLASSHQMFGAPQWYGRGLMLYEVPVPDGPPQVWIGHSGGAPGAGTVVAWSPSHQAYVAVAFTGRSSAEAVANGLLAALAASAAR